MKVEKQVNEAMTWMNNKMNLQSKHSLSQAPLVQTQEIRAKTKVQQKSKQLLYNPRKKCITHQNFCLGFKSCDSVYSSVALFFLYFDA